MTIAPAGKMVLVSNLGKLLKAILANPDDDQLRLVYADALTQEGHPQGEYIACVFSGHADQANELLNRHRRLFTEGLRGPKISEWAFEFERGLAAHVELTTDELSQLTRIRTRAPIRSVKLRFGSLREWPRTLEGLRRLELHGLTDADARILAPGLGGLEELAANSGYSLGAEAVIALVRGAPRLRRLDLGPVERLTDDVARVIAALPLLEDLRFSGIGDGALAALGRAPSLRSLRVDDHPFGLRAGELAAWTGPARLDRLDLAHGRLGPTGLRTLLASPMVRDVAALDLSWNQLGDEGVAILAEAALPRLRQLWLAGNGIGSAGGRTLAEAFAGLTTLRLELGATSDYANLVDDDVAEALRARYGRQSLT
jgi:uncharacterized protein (TIGR02996 family)